MARLVGRSGARATDTDKKNCCRQTRSVPSAISPTTPARMRTRSSTSSICFSPRERSDFPVVMFVHGGAWVFGDKDFFGAHEAIGRMFARHGIGAAVISYRLSPGVKHPEHVKDVARAFAWLHNNVKNYGGRPDELFVCGHSAGGHLVALLATDESISRPKGLSSTDIKGVMPISGVYLIPDKWFNDVFGTDPRCPQDGQPAERRARRLPAVLRPLRRRRFPDLRRSVGEILQCAQGQRGLGRIA